MADAPAAPPPLSVAVRIGLALGGLAAGMAITLLVLRAVAPKVVAPAPAPPESGGRPAPTAAQTQAGWARLRATVEALAADESAARLYGASTLLQQQYPSPAAWSAARQTLRGRLRDLPTELPGPASGWVLSVHGRAPGPEGQDIIGVTSPDGGRAVVFFDGEQVAELELPAD
jgi:hypothetical protein